MFTNNFIVRHKEVKTQKMRSTMMMVLKVSAVTSR